jgi:hypothetical protein
VDQITKQESNPTKPESPYRIFMFHHSVYCFVFFFFIVLSANPSPEVPEGTRLQKKKGIEKDML